MSQILKIICTFFDNKLLADAPLLCTGRKTKGWKIAISLIVR